MQNLDNIFVTLPRLQQRPAQSTYRVLTQSEAPSPASRFPGGEAGQHATRLQESANGWKAAMPFSIRVVDTTVQRRLVINSKL
jgi:hypothetical protein